MIFEHRVIKHYLCSKLEEPPQFPRRQVLGNGSSNTCFLQPNLDGERSKLILSCGWVEAGEVKFSLAIDMALLENMTEKTRVRSINETLALCNHAH